jgi:hypothetical protein
MSEEDWKLIEPDIRFTFNQDSYFSELKQTEIMKDRIDLLTSLEEYVGKYYSEDWVRKNILQQSEEEIVEIDGQIQSELESDNVNMEEQPIEQGEG